MDGGRKELITVKESKFGKGTFATLDISQGSPIICIKGIQISFRETLELGKLESFCLQVGINDYIIPDQPFRYTNHSCNPNSGINDKLELFSLRPICEGEEVNWDYSTSMLERHWTMRCHCGSPSCRQQITDFDLLPEQIQENYLRRGMVFPFIVEYLKQRTSPVAFVNEG